ncbi:MAG: TetR/AcrR family transcriptional regulator [Acidobacteria bacterium]|nr:TetR/AcrR family transcriptional regulator [Acidobacteriota bacterium]
MGRTKEFDVEQALDAALCVFWRKGYEAASIQDLVEATGVNRASLYATFGHKRNLFLRTLDRFAAGSGNVEHATAGIAPGLARVRAVLELAADQTAHDVRGCLIVNAIVERGAQDPDMQTLGEAARTQLERFFAGCLAEAERQGEIAARRDLLTLARFLTNTLFGLRVTAKTRPGPEVVQAIVDTVLQTVEK